VGVAINQYIVSGSVITARQHAFVYSFPRSKCMHATGAYTRFSITARLYNSLPHHIVILHSLFESAIAAQSLHYATDICEGQIRSRETRFVVISCREFAGRIGTRWNTVRCYQAKHPT